MFVLILQPRAGHKLEHQKEGRGEVSVFCAGWSIEIRAGDSPHQE